MIKATELLKNTVILSYSVHCWTNNGKANIANIETEAEKSRLRVTKKLVDSDQLKAVRDYQNKAKGWIKMRSVPAFFKDALVLVKTDMVKEVEQKLNDSVNETSELVEAFLAAYPAQKEAAKKALGNMYEERDYPTANELRSSFGITWNWIELNVSENLPDTIRARESKKLNDMWENSIQEIIMALRTGFKEFVDHAVDRLTVKPGEKAKTFRDSLIPNFQQFLDTFSARNVVNDAELAALVDKAKKLISGVSPEDLRDDTKLRDFTAKKFAELKKSVDEAVTTATRKFDFSDK